MAKLDVKKTATATSLTLGTLSLVWGIAVAIGGERMVDRIMWLHFLSNPVGVYGFNLSQLIASVAYHLAIGAIVGVVFATVWNKVQK